MPSSPLSFRELFVSCPMGLSTLLKNELELLDIPCFNLRPGGLSIPFSLENLYTVSYKSSIAIRILLPIRDFQIWKQRNLYQQVKKMPWERWLTENDTFLFRATGKSRAFSNLQFACQLAKDALADSFMERIQKRPSVSKDEPSLTIHLHFHEDHLTISLDTTGRPLNQRNYFHSTPPIAPLNECIAAAMVKSARTDRASTILDPCCGSATLLLESLMHVMKIPSGYFRYHNSIQSENESANQELSLPWAFMNWEDFHTDLLEKIISKWDSNISTKTPPLHIGYEKDYDVFQIAKKRADEFKSILASRGFDNLNDSFKLIHADCKDLDEKTLIPFTLITNAPFGKRLALHEETHQTLLKLAYSSRYSCWVAPNWAHHPLKELQEDQTDPTDFLIKKIDFSMSGEPSSIELYRHKPKFKNRSTD